MRGMNKMKRRQPWPRVIKEKKYEKCEICSKSIMEHDECGNMDCASCGSLVFCDHQCRFEFEDE